MSDRMSIPIEMTVEDMILLTLALELIMKMDPDEWAIKISALNPEIPWHLLTEATDVQELRARAGPICDAMLKGMTETLATGITKMSAPGVKLVERMHFTGTGQVIGPVHERSKCEGRDYGCVIHAPSDHHMREWPTNWRGDRRLMERICPHGVGHPDPDDAEFQIRELGKDMDTLMSHSCDGCCSMTGPDD